MRRRKRGRWLLLFLLPFMLLAACTKTVIKKAEKAEMKEEQLLIAAAASLETVLETNIIPAFEKEHPTIKVTGSYDSSGKLQTQIEKGLAADLFFSAATKQMTALVDQKLIDAKSVLPLLENQLVLIVPNDTKASWHDFADLQKAQTIAVGDPASVPAGQYAKIGLTKLGYWEYVQQHASFGTNVTEVLEWVANKSAEAGLVYATDAAKNQQVKVVAALPKSVLEEPIVYPVGKIAASKKQKIADTFLTFLQEKQARAYFEEAGFKWNQ